MQLKFIYFEICRKKYDNFLNCFIQFKYIIKSRKKVFRNKIGKHEHSLLSNRLKLNLLSNVFIVKIFELAVGRMCITKTITNCVFNVFLCSNLAPLFGDIHKVHNFISIISRFSLLFTQTKQVKVQQQKIDSKYKFHL